MGQSPSHGDGILRSIKSRTLNSQTYANSLKQEDHTDYSAQSLSVLHEPSVNPITAVLEKNFSAHFPRPEKKIPTNH